MDAQQVSSVGLSGATAFLRILVVAAFATLALLAAAACAGRFLWRRRTNGILSRLDAARDSFPPVAALSREELPAPVARYFDLVLPPAGTPLAGVTMRHEGLFNMSEDGERWMPFTSRQVVSTQRPGFVWDARIRVASGLDVNVHDAYVAGEGELHAALLGLVTVAHAGGTPAIAQGELMRFLAEAVWYPPVLLPGRNVRWEAVDGRSARAFLADGGMTVPLLFVFGEDGLVDGVRADARMRTVGDSAVPTPWSGTFRNYDRRNGYLVPIDGEVSWLFPDGPKPYWRGRLADIRHGIDAGAECFARMEASD